MSRSSLRSAGGAAAVGQDDLFGRQDDLPEGFRYQADLITAEEESELVRELQNLPFEPFDFHGHLANRRVVGFGLRYDYDRRAVVEASPIPDFLMPLRDKVAVFADRPAPAFQQVLINEYREGAGIGWHRDKPHFEDVGGVSLLAPCSPAAAQERREMGPQDDHRRAEVGISDDGSGAQRLGAQHSAAFWASLLDNAADIARLDERGYAAQEATRMEIVGIKHRLDGLEKSMEAIKPTTAELERVRDRVLFAGRLGAVLWSIGKH